MLTSDLLLARTKKEKIYPLFKDEKEKDLAEEILSIYRGSIGARASEIDEEVTELEEQMNFKFVRGLRTLLDRRCVFESKAVIDPILARREVFRETFRGDKKKREEVLGSVSRKLNLTTSELETSLWADRDAELVLRDFSDIRAEELLKEYNLSLSQTLLFKSMGMDVWYEGSYEPFFRAIKYFGLLYHAEVGDGESIHVRIDGPLSLFKLTERYGTSLAKLLPIIIGGKKWRIDAEVVIRSQRIFHFIMGKDAYQRFFPAVLPIPEGFDSSLEERFYHRFKQIPGWVVKREVKPLIAGRWVYIPDFKFEKDGMEVYLEIAGFWTEEYIKKKVEKLSLLKEDVIVAVDSDMLCSHLFTLKMAEVVEFKNDVDLLSIVRILREKERKRIESEMKKIPADISPVGDIVSLEELAVRYGVGVDAMRGKEMSGYRVVGDKVVSISFLDGIREELRGKSYQRAKEKIEGYGLSADLVLNELGLRVVWDGLKGREIQW
jgi:hypothetical protein